jgi:hypothetical protein
MDLGQFQKLEIIFNNPTTICKPFLIKFPLNRKKLNKVTNIKETGLHYPKQVGFSKLLFYPKFQLTIVN